MSVLFWILDKQISYEGMKPKYFKMTSCGGLRQKACTINPIDGSSDGNSTYCQAGLSSHSDGICYGTDPGYEIFKCHGEFHFSGCTQSMVKVGGGCNDGFSSGSISNACNLGWDCSSVSLTDEALLRPDYIGATKCYKEVLLGDDLLCDVNCV